MKLNPDRVSSWVRSDGTKGLCYAMDVDDLVTDPHVLRAAVDAGMQIATYGGIGTKEVTSLAFLAPIIAEVRDLWIGTANKITDVEILTEARHLRSLGFAVGSCVGRADLSILPYLEEFKGSISRAVGSVMHNPRLRFLNVLGSVPKSFMNVAGPVEIYLQEGGRSQAEVPFFAQPEAMRSFTRIGTARFDIGQLAEMSTLAEFELSLCGDVTGLSVLSRLPALNRLALKSCTTTERWEGLPNVPQGLLIELNPVPSRAFLNERRRAGWIITEMDDEPPAALVLEESGDGASWGVFMSRFEDLTEAVDNLDGSAAHGFHGERFILGVVAELRSQGATLDPEPDSESASTAVYFPDRVQAHQVYARAQELLSGDASTQLKYLRGGVPKTKA